MIAASRQRCEREEYKTLKRILLGAFSPNTVMNFNLKRVNVYYLDIVTIPLHKQPRTTIISGKREKVTV